jgi:hypothetical protein
VVAGAIAFCFDRYNHANRNITIFWRVLTFCVWNRTQVSQKYISYSYKQVKKVFIIIQSPNHPTNRPTNRRTIQPIAQLSNRLSDQSHNHPTNCPTIQPIVQPIAQPSNQLSNQSSNHATNCPTMQPSNHPTNRPTI